MNLLRKIIFVLIDLVCFVGGAILFLYSLSQLYAFRTLFGEDEANYVYNSDISVYIEIGIGLLVLGIVIRAWRKDLSALPTAGRLWRG